MADQSWQKTACILCSVNCGIEVQTSDRRITLIRGDREHPASQGYLCEKPQRLDFYQNGKDRLTQPLRRRADGGFEPVSWETAISEIAAKFDDIQQRHGGEAIFYYGGGGQANHLGGTYADSTRRALGVKFKSNALAQEKTGEFWVSGRMFGAGTHGDYEHCELAMFVGKNPWQSHGLQRARAVLRDIQKDPNRAIIVIDPRRSETAEMADYHLAIKPGTDAWCLAALVAVLVQENLIASDWLAEHATGADEIAKHFAAISVAEYAAICGVPETLLREAARRIARAKSVSVYEDLGLQMTVHSTLSSYLERLVWLLTGNFAKPGTASIPSPLTQITVEGLGGKRPSEKVSPVTGARVISGLIPCNAIPEEILTDHPKRFRAMLVESANPAHSLADTVKMKQALSSLELLVVIDVAMTETARLAHYVLPAPSQYEKYEASYFNLEFPDNFFHLRQPIFEPQGDVLPEPEIHARLVEALGAIREADLKPLREAAAQGRPAFAQAFFAAMQSNPRIAELAPVVLYRTLGPTLGKAASAAALWGVCHLYVRRAPEQAARAGFGGDPFLAAERLFDAILQSPSGVVFSKDVAEGSWHRVRLPDGKINLLIPELLPELEKLRTEPLRRDTEFPFILSAGERRSGTANTIYRDPEWRKKSRELALRIHPDDAAAVGVSDGEPVRVITRRGEANIAVELSERMQRGHVSLPNGTGLDYDKGNGAVCRAGVAPNELTSLEDRDFLAGTPWHKHVPARIERIG
jgi:anaerobic selenocysteine-containing dehydrogenase